MNLLEPIQKSLSETDNSYENINLKLLFPDVKKEIKEEVVYRRDGKSIDKIVEFDKKTGLKIRITHYDYFNDKKIRSIDEYNKETGKKIYTINYVLYKSIDEYDKETGKKIRTINFNVKDESKISSIQEYDIKSGKIIKISIYKRDGRSVSIIKNINPETNEVTNTFNKYIENKPIDISKYTRFYDDYKTMNEEQKEDIARLIDNLYNKNLNFEKI